MSILFSLRIIENNTLGIQRRCGRTSQSDESNGAARAPGKGYEINSVYTREQDESEGIIVPRLGIGSV